MVTLIGALILISFLQSSVIPYDLVFLALVGRSFVADDKNNYYLAFAFGLLLSFLTVEPLGLHSLVYLLAVRIIYLIKKAPFASHWLFIVPATMGLYAFNQFSISLILGTTFHSNLILLHGFLVLPVYLLIKMWEERFIYKEVKLKFKK